MSDLMIEVPGEQDVSVRHWNDEDTIVLEVSDSECTGLAWMSVAQTEAVIKALQSALASVYT
jgi:hypothetical protein